MKDNQNGQEWTEVILPQNKLFDLKLKEIYRYRDLLVQFVVRDFIATYKQTILGPLWFFIQPIFTTLIFAFVFGRVAGISTEGIPHILFYMSGLVPWTYFSECVSKTSETFIQNSKLFGKVYFPRVIMPLSIAVSNLLKFGVQLLLLVCCIIYFSVFTPFALSFSFISFLLPFFILLLAMFGLSIGMIVTAMTTKYRDLRFLVQFGVQLMMYTTPVIYPVSSLPEKYKIFILLNPVTSIIEGFRLGIFGAGNLDWGWFTYSTLVTFFSFVIGFLVFNKVEKTFIDSV